MQDAFRPHQLQWCNLEMGLLTHAQTESDGGWYVVEVHCYVTNGDSDIFLSKR